MILAHAANGAVVPIDKPPPKVGVSKRLRDIVARATAPNPDDRYQDVVELQRDVVSFLRGGLHLPRKLFPAGRVIIREGDVGDAAYMIVSGRCRAFRTVGDRAGDARDHARGRRLRRDGALARRAARGERRGRRLA